MAQYVDVHLDRPRRLRYTINGIRELERHFGKSFNKIIDAAELGFEEIIMLVTIGLKYGETEKRPLTDTKVGDLIQKKWLENDKSLGDLTDHVIEALRAGGIIAKKEEEDEEEEKPAKDENLPNV